MFAKEFRDTLVNSKYEDESDVQYTDYFIRILITNWTDVKPVAKNLIHASALSNNFQISNEG